MDAAIIAAIAELAKLGMFAVVSYMQQAGLTPAQIEETFQAAKAGMLARDPKNIPSA